MKDRLDETENPETTNIRQRRLTDEIHNEYFAQQQINPKTLCWLMLDPSLRDASLQPDFAECILNIKPHTNTEEFRRILWSHASLSPQHRPYLVPLNLERYADAEVLRRSVEMAFDDWKTESIVHGRGHRICAWIMSSRPKKELAIHLGACAVQRNSEGKSLLLRYYDPSVMPHLWKISNKTQQKKLLYPINLFLMTNIQGRLIRYSGDDLYIQEGESALAYSSEQWIRINSIEAINSTLVRWLTRARAIPDDSYVLTVERAINRAIGHGITGLADLNAYAWHSLIIHPDFDHHPTIIAALRALRENSSYGTAIESLQNTDWQAIQRDLIQKATPIEGQS